MDSQTDVKPLIRDLVLVLADNKRLLGMRYAGWILGAPELEAGIACASMAQDEWGHGRLLYALLKEFGEDVDRLEHGREADEYRNAEVLDVAPQSWPEHVVANVLVDGALTVQLEALRESSWAPARQRVGKMIEEERFHTAHGAAWFRRLALGGETSRAALVEAVNSYLPNMLRWFGPDSERATALADSGTVNGAGSELRSRYVERTTALLGVAGVDAATVAGDVAFDSFDEVTRRNGPGGPDTRTLTQVRGDKNRAFLMD